MMKMNKSTLMGVVLVAILAVFGCTSKLKDLVLGEPQAKSEVKAMRSHQAYLEQQVQSLQDLNDKLTEHAESLTTQLKRIRDREYKEQADAEERMRNLEQAVTDLTIQYETLRVEFKKTTRENKTLKTAVARYRKEQKDGRPLLAQNTAPAPRSAEPKPRRSHKKEPAKSVKAKAVKSDSPPVNINMASRHDLVLSLGLTNDVADRVVSNRPYRIKGELVAKHILPKETFHLIKDRVTAAP